MGSRVAVVGAGWAGLAAAIEATRAGHQVVLSDMAGSPGGRARSVGDRDNGQHVLIGACRETLALMRLVGVDPGTVLARLPLALVDADGLGLRLPEAPPAIAFIRGVLAARGFTWSDRLSLLRWAWRWWRAGFECDASLRVAELAASCTAAAYRKLIEPLCISALNTPAECASARVFLQVLREALFAGRGGSDLLLPRVPLSSLLPDPALRWLTDHGVECRWRCRALQIGPAPGAGWLLDGEPFDALILACSASEAARLAAPVSPPWQRLTAALHYQPILTVVLREPRFRLPLPMLALRSSADAPAQFVFDLDQLGRAAQCHAFVVSSAGSCLTAGIEAAAQAVLRQARAVFPGAFRAVDAIEHATAERRATFACTAGLERPPLRIAPNLLAAGDYVDGPYPATIEGAVRAGLGAARAIV